MPKKQVRSALLSKQEKTSAEQNEEIEVLGQESDTKAVKWVQEVEKRNQKKEDEHRAVEEETLHSSRSKLYTYPKAILGTCRRRMIEFDEFVPHGFMWIAQLAKKEKSECLEIWIRDPKDRFYCKAMQISRLPKYDLNWIDNAINKGLDSMDAINQELEEEKTNAKKVELKINGKKIYL